MTDASIPSLQTMHDPLPEASWFWRRVFTFIVTGCVMWMIWGGIARLGATAIMDPRRGIGALADLCRWLLLFNAMMVTYYMVAPSAEQIVKMVQTASLFKNNVQLATRGVQEDGKTEIATTVGKPPQPEAPKVPEVTSPSKKETQVLE